MSLLTEWAEAIGDYRIFGDSEIETQSGRRIAYGTDERVTVFYAGDMAVQGEPVELDLDGDVPTLIIEGERYAWDDGPVRWKGRFAVMSNGGYPVDIDGPLPEDDET